MDPNVKKIINNDYFIAALAPVLADEWSSGSDLAAACRRVSTAAKTYAKMLSALGVVVKIDHDWEGCDQAKLLVQWIVQESNPPADAVEQIDKWTRDIWSAIADLAAGKMPA